MKRHHLTKIYDVKQKNPKTATHNTPVVPLALKGSVSLQCIKYKTQQAFQGKLHCESTSVRQTAVSRHICLVFATANVIVSKGNALIGGHVLTCSIQCRSCFALKTGYYNYIPI